MKKYAAALLSVFLVCGCSNITPNNEKVEASQEKLENMTALYTGLAEANETIDNKSKIGIWAYYEDGTKEFITLLITKLIVNTVSKLNCTHN